MRHVRQVLMIATSSLFLGCCLKSVSLKPEMDDVGVAGAKAGAIKASIDFTFQECCPTKDQERIALNIQRKVDNLFADLVAGKIRVADYNLKVKAARDAIGQVVLLCAAKPAGRSAIMATGGLPAAWAHARKVEEGL